MTLSLAITTTTIGTHIFFFLLRRSRPRPYERGTASAYEHMSIAIVNVRK